jgi:hypothetical protein
MPKSTTTTDAALERSSGIARGRWVQKGGEHLVRIRHRDGREELVSPARAARLLRAEAADPCAWTVEDLREVEEAERRLRVREAERLRADGLLCPGAWTRRDEVEGWKW